MALNIISGDDTGLIKYYRGEPAEIEHAYGTQGKYQGIQCTHWLPKKKLSISVRENGELLVIDPYAKVFTKIGNLPISGTLGDFQRVKGVEWIEEPNGDLKAIYCLEGGALYSYTLNYNKYIEESKELDSDSEEEVGAVGLGQFTSSYISKFRAVPMSETSYIGVGKNTPIQIWDINKGSSIWKGKNVGVDKLDMVIPMWDTDVCMEALNPPIVYTSTAYGDVRKYDTRVQCKPILDRKLGDSFPFTHIRINQTAHTLALPAQDGRIYILDVRKDLSVDRIIKGAKGSIKDIILSPHNPYLVSSSFDRHIRIHNYLTATTLQDIYSKQVVTSLCFWPLIHINGKAKLKEKSNKLGIQSISVRRKIKKLRKIQKLLIQMKYI